MNVGTWTIGCYYSAMTWQIVETAPTVQMIRNTERVFTQGSGVA